MVLFNEFLSIPRPVVALPWGSRSTRRVRRSARARPAERLTAVVVFPTPPFWLATATTLARPSPGNSTFFQPAFGHSTFGIALATGGPEAMTVPPRLRYGAAISITW